MSSSPESSSSSSKKARKEKAGASLTGSDLDAFVRVHAALKAPVESQWFIDKKNVLNRVIDLITPSQFWFEAKLEEDKRSGGDGWRNIKLFLHHEHTACGTLGSPKVDQILACAKAAPFGRGGKTVLDPAVRKASAVDAKHIHFSHENFPIASKDGGRFRAWCGIEFDDMVLYKMHIYAEGGHFASHVDTPHAAGHVGSAIIILGSPHTGGALVVKHKGEEKRFEGAGTVAAWYTDCEHWVEPVTSGHRIVLQFDIINSRVAVAEPADLEPHAMKEIASAKASEESSSDHEMSASDDDNDGYALFAESWTSTLAVPTVLKFIGQQVAGSVAKGWDIALPLQHLYFNQGGLVPETLKGADRLMWDTLVAAGVKVALVACRAHETDSRAHAQDWTVGQLGTRPASRNKEVHFIPGTDEEKFYEVFRNPGADHTGNESMPREGYYLGAVIFCYRPRDGDDANA